MALLLTHDTLNNTRSVHFIANKWDGRYSYNLPLPISFVKDANEQ